MNIEFILQQLLNGIFLRGVYALEAVGFGIIFNILKFSNFSHGGVVAIGKGDILLDNESIKIPPRQIVRKGIVRVPEGRRIFPSISVRENLILGAFSINRKIYETNTMNSF